MGFEMDFTFLAPTRRVWGLVIWAPSVRTYFRGQRFLRSVWIKYFETLHQMSPPNEDFVSVKIAPCCIKYFIVKEFQKSLETFS